MKIGQLMIDTQGCRVTKGEKEIELTAREFEILNYMAENIGRVISRERLYAPQLCLYPVCYFFGTKRFCYIIVTAYCQAKQFIQFIIF